MYIPITTATLALITVAMVFLRIYWLRIPGRLRFFLLRGSIVLIILHAFFQVTKWNTTSDRLNVSINWLAIAGYQLLVLLFSRLSPRWLTVPCAVILLIPLFAASILQPLVSLFQPASYRRQAIDDHHFYEVVPWANVGGGNAGVDVQIYYSPRFVPFLRHRLQNVPFNNRECNAYAAFATLGSAPRTVLGHCPRWGAEPAGTFDKLLPFR
jgi:hypothetical protein